MGTGDNRSTPKSRQRAAWRRKKARVKKKIESGKAGKAALKTGAVVGASAAPTPVKKKVSAAAGTAAVRKTPTTAATTPAAE